MNARRLGGLAGYGLSVGLSAIVTLLSIPVVIAAVGAGAWASLALAQAVGSAAAIVIGFGWGITGPTEIASAEPRDRLVYFTNSLWGRASIAVPATACAAIVTAVAAPSQPGPAALGAVAYALTGLLTGWYFTGVAKPWSFFSLDALPRVVGVAVGAVMVSLGLPLWIFPLAVLLGVLAGICATIRRITGRFLPGRVRRAVLLQVLRAQSHGMQLSSVSAVVTALPPLIVSIAAPAGLPAYTLGDKLFRFATTAFSPVLQFLQGWVPAVAGQQRAARAKKAATIGISAALVAACTFALVAPLMSRLLSHGKVDLGPLLGSAFALALASVIAAQAVGLIGLLSLGATRSYARYTIVGASVGVPLTIVGAIVAGGVGAAAGFATGELIAVVLEARLFVRLVRGSDPDERGVSGALPTG